MSISFRPRKQRKHLGEMSEVLIIPLYRRMKILKAVIGLQVVAMADVTLTATIVGEIILPMSRIVLNMTMSMWQATILRGLCVSIPPG